jgi:hypothetical protein
MIKSFTRFVAGPVILGVAALAFFAPGTSRAQNAVKPTFVIRVASIDTLMGHIFQVAKAIGREGEVQLAEALLKNFTGGGGIEGLDTKKPWGMYGKIGPGGIDSEGVLLLPISDQKKFLAFLEKLGQKAEEKKGIYTLNIDQSPFPLFFRFEKGYLWGTIRDEKSIDPATLPATEEFLAASKTGAMSLTFDFSAIPDEIKKMVVGQIEVAMGQAREKATAEKDPIKRKGQLVGAEAAGKTIVQVMNEGGELALKMDLEKATNDLVMELSFSGKPGSLLAKDMASMGSRKGVSGGLVGPDSAYYLGMNFGLSESFAKLISESYNQGVADALANETDEKKKEWGLKLSEAFRKLVSSGVVDYGADIRGPGANGKYNIIAAVGFPDARKLESVIRELRNEVPELAQVIQLDVAKTEKVTIHRIAVEPLPKEISDLVGNTPILVGFSDEAVYFGLGSEGQKNIEKQAEKGKTAAPLFAFDVHLGNMVNILSKTDPKMIAAAKKAFDGKSGSDLIEVKVASGEKLVVRASMRTQVIAFFSLLVPKQGEEPKRDQ